MKTCCTCKVTKSYESFPVLNAAKDGRHLRCKACKNSRAREAYAKNPKAFNEYSRALYAAQPEVARASRAKSRAKNPTTTRQSRKNWRLSNPGKVNSYTAEYRADKLKATPLWLTPEQRQEIVAIYENAKELTWLSESPLEVDHILPLRGENVCGLHVPWNLQIIPASVNRAKSNKWRAA